MRIAILDNKELCLVAGGQCICYCQTTSPTVSSANIGPILAAAKDVCITYCNRIHEAFHSCESLNEAHVANLYAQKINPFHIDQIVFRGIEGNEYIVYMNKHSGAIYIM